MVTQGRVPYHEHDDRDIREALAQALGERKTRLNDRRLLIIYTFIVLLVAGTFYYLSSAQHHSDADRKHFQEAVARNCQLNRRNTIGFNAFINTLEDTYRSSTVLTEKQIHERIVFFNRAKQKVATCPSAEPAENSK